MYSKELHVHRKYGVEFVDLTDFIQPEHDAPFYDKMRVMTVIHYMVAGRCDSAYYEFAIG